MWIFVALGLFAALGLRQAPATARVHLLGLLGMIGVLVYAGIHMSTL